MKRRLGSGRISPPTEFDHATLCSEVGSANRSATGTLQLTKDIRRVGVVIATVLTLDLEIL